MFSGFEILRHLGMFCRVRGRPLQLCCCLPVSMEGFVRRGCLLRVGGAVCLWTCCYWFSIVMVRYGTIILLLCCRPG